MRGDAAFRSRLCRREAARFDAHTMCAWLGRKRSIRYAHTMLLKRNTLCAMMLYFGRVCVGERRLASTRTPCAPGLNGSTRYADAPRGCTRHAGTPATRKRWVRMAALLMRHARIWRSAYDPETIWMCRRANCRCAAYNGMSCACATHMC